MIVSSFPEMKAGLKKGNPWIWSQCMWEIIREALTAPPLSRSRSPRFLMPVPASRIISSLFASRTSTQGVFPPYRTVCFPGVEIEPRVPQKTSRIGVRLCCVPVCFDVVDIMLGRLFELQPLLRRQLPDDPGGNSRSHHPFRNERAGADDGAGREESIGIYSCIIKDYGPHSDQAEVADRAPVENCPVPDGDLFPDTEGKFRMRHMEEAAVLDIGSLSDPDRVDVSPDDGVEPDAGILPDLHVADDLGACAEEGGFVDRRGGSAVGVNHFSGPPGARGGTQPPRFHFISSMRILPRTTFIFAITGTRAASFVNQPSKPPVSPMSPTNPAVPSKWTRSMG